MAMLAPTAFQPSGPMAMTPSSSISMARRVPTVTTSHNFSPTNSEFSDDDDGPDAVRNWNEDRVCEYLRSVKCAEYEPLFRLNNINGENLLELDKDVLKEMGIEKVGDRVRLFLGIKKLRTKAYANHKKRNRDSFALLDPSYVPPSSNYSSRPFNSSRTIPTPSSANKRISRQFESSMMLDASTISSGSRPASPLPSSADSRKPQQQHLQSTAASSATSRYNNQSPILTSATFVPSRQPTASPDGVRQQHQQQHQHQQSHSQQQTLPRLVMAHTRNNSSVDGSLMAALPQGQDVIRVISTGGVTKVVKIADCSTCEDVMRVTLRKFALREDHERNYCFWVLSGVDPDPGQCRRLGDTELWRIIKDQKRPERNRLILRRVPSGEPGEAELQRAAAIALEEATQNHARALTAVDKRSQAKVQKVLGETWEHELQHPLSPYSYQDRERNLSNTARDLERPATRDSMAPPKSSAASTASRKMMRPFGGLRPPSELITSDLTSYFPDHAREDIDRTVRLSMRRSVRLSRVNHRLSVASNLSFASTIMDAPPIPTIADTWRSSGQLAKVRSRDSAATAGRNQHRDSVASSMLGTLREEGNNNSHLEPNRKSYVSFTDSASEVGVSVTDADGNPVPTRNSYYDGESSTLSASTLSGGSYSDLTQALTEDGEEVDPELQSFLAGESWDDNKWMQGALIGQGSFGCVYLALHAVTGELLAVKQVETPSPNSANSQVDNRKKSMIEALKREIGLLRELKHPNIVQYLGCSSSAEYLNIFLEYVPGGSVQTMLNSYGALPEPLVRSFVRQILTGLSYLHNMDIIHRDIKGANILVDNKGTIKISDFGISKKIETSNILSSNGGAGNNRHRPSLQGSVFWMAPEVVKQTSYTRKADIWSLGCLVVEMMTGSHPFPDCSQLQAIFKIGGGKATPTIPENASEDAVEFLSRTFELDHNLRPSADELMHSAFLVPVA